MRALVLLATVGLIAACGDDATGRPGLDNGDLADVTSTGDADSDTSSDAPTSPTDDTDDATSDGPTPIGTDLVVLTFNIKADDSFGAAFDEATSWNFAADDEDDRRDRVVSTLDRLNADLVCMQEARPDPVEYLLANSVVSYAHHGAERGGENAPDDMNGLLYRTDRLTFVDGGHFWLSETPDEPGTTFVARDDDNSRMASWATFDDQRAARRFTALCTHWSLDSSARQSSARLIRERLLALGSAESPTVVLGDLNATESDREVRILRGEEDPDGDLYVDAFRALVPTRMDDERTYHAFDGTTSGERIDFVFHDAAFVATDVMIDRWRTERGYPSDHYPVRAVLQWGE